MIFFIGYFLIFFLGYNTLAQDTLYHKNIRRSISSMKGARGGSLVLTDDDQLIFNAHLKTEKYDFDINIDSIDAVKKSGGFIFFYTKCLFPNMVSISLKNSSVVIRFYTWKDGN